MQSACLLMVFVEYLPNSEYLVPDIYIFLLKAKPKHSEYSLTKTDIFYEMGNTDPKPLIKQVTDSH